MLKIAHSLIGKKFEDKSANWIHFALVVFVCLLIFQGCKKETPKEMPTVSLVQVSNITSSSATSGGAVSTDGGASVTAKGVCWSTNQNPTVSDNKTSDGTGTGSFSSSISGLAPGVTYYIRAYATNSIGTAYSSSTSFTVPALAPALTTSPISEVTATSLISGGNIANDGGSPITARGVCWSTNSNPTTADSKTSEGASLGVFISKIEGLMPGVTYHIRAYAINAIGTAYGNEITTSALAILPVLSTTSAATVTSISAQTGGKISTNGGATVTEKGIYWGTSENPETNGTKLVVKDSINEFIAPLTDLAPNTTYYVKAFAVNSQGTAYGNLISFKTDDLDPAVIDVSQNKKWDYWVIAKDGSNYFVKLNNNKPLYAYFHLKKNDPGYYVSFDEFGLPSKMVTDNFVFIFSNFRNQLADVAVVVPGGEINIVRDVKGNINLDLFYRKSFLTDLAFGLNMTSNVLGIVSCVGGLAAAASVVAAPVSVGLLVGCGTTLVGIYAPLIEEKLPVLGLTSTTVSTVSDAVGCLGKDFGGCLSLGVAGAAGFVDAANTVLGFIDVPSVTTLLLRPTLRTIAVSSITSNTALSGGTISSNGGAPITDKGVCWGTNPNPYITTNNFVSSGTGNNEYTCSLTGLLPNTLYYVKAYATNSAGTSYGNQITFTTNDLPNIKNTTWDVTVIFDDKTSWHANVTFNADGTTKYDEPACPGCYLTYGKWSLNGNKIHWDIGFKDSYIFDGDVNGNSMSGTWIYASKQKLWTAVKR